MLAYELFSINKESTTNDPRGGSQPIKKIFFQNDKVTIDKDLEEYTSEYLEKTKQLQDWLQMPLNTIDKKELNLPDMRVSFAQPSPYIEVYGNVKTNKNSESVLSITIGKKPNIIEYSLNVPTGEITQNENSKVRLKIDDENYFLKNSNLFTAYVDSGILDKDGTINNDAFEIISRKFLEYAKTRPCNLTKQENLRFRIYILPNNSEIKVKEKEITTDGDLFLDYFGNTSSEYASTPTTTTKFLSYDDKAFTINCKQKSDFYKNLGIGKGSLQKIFRPKEKTFNISGLEWTFVDISDNKHKFRNTGKGILTQLYENYKILSKGGHNEQVNLKILCVRVNQAKQELLIDENLTMKQMSKMFSKIDEIPFSAFEVLIDKSNKNPLWNTYLYVVKNFLSGNTIPKEFLLTYFTKLLRHKIFDWIKIKNNTEQIEFFSKSEFCIKYLINTDFTQNYLNSNEEYALRIGQIARLYVDFKYSNKDGDNSLGDILTYSKYDRERLRFVYSRISRGVQLAKVADASKDSVTKKISSLRPKEEISDEDASKDYSYFFFNGYYSTQEIKA
ncbi:MAG: hypothetical protein COY74_06935 [Nitrosopumilales archaeon CG_4_10_14_0_8_um_filter_34_8]|nr:MAG: hypothetical protein COY74_06935 [Nitrosopumilales archaeon CG_4_10_14_0_8_um_filter_34_8]